MRSRPVTGLGILATAFLLSAMKVLWAGVRLYGRSRVNTYTVPGGCTRRGQCKGSTVLTVTLLITMSVSAVYVTYVRGNL